MIVCVCCNVSDRAVGGAVEAGARTVAEIARATGAGTSCGCCRETIEAMVSERSPCASPACAGCPHKAAIPARDAA